MALNGLKELQGRRSNAVRPKVGLGTALAIIGRSVGGFELDLKRDASPVRPAQFD